MKKDPIIQSLFDRKSVRVFTEEPLTGEEKALLLEAAFQAPTAGCQQLYTILDITDQGEKETLAELCDHQPFIAAAPGVFVFCADCQKWLDAYTEAGIEARKPQLGDALLAMADAVIAAQNMVAAAQALDLGSCYIGDILENEEQVREVLGLPNYVFPAAMLVVGHPTQGQRERSKPARFEGQYVVQENRYRRLNGEELREMFRQKAGLKGYDEWVKAFCQRKYESDFSREMSRSAQRWMGPFQP
jgi:nitroreductase/FMN reductase (NADPH)/FMN reductase [NAD(P)H]